MIDGAAGGVGSAALPKVAELVDAGAFTVAVDSTFSLADAAKAQGRGQSGHVHGKIIIKIIEG